MVPMMGDSAVTSIILGTTVLRARPVKLGLLPRVFLAHRRQPVNGLMPCRDGPRARRAANWQIRERRGEIKRLAGCRAAGTTRDRRWAVLKPIADKAHAL